MVETTKSVITHDGIIMGKAVDDITAEYKKVLGIKPTKEELVETLKFVLDIPY